MQYRISSFWTDTESQLVKSLKHMYVQVLFKVLMQISFNFKLIFF